MKNAVALLLGCIVALLAAEGAVRLLSPAQLGFVYTGRGFRKPVDFRRDIAKAPRNRLGFHDAEPVAKGPRLTRVALLGDSYVAALSVDVPQIVGQRLEHHLNARAHADGDGRLYDVVSLGWLGWGLERELAALREHGPGLQPDLVVTLFLALNDLLDDSPELERATKAQLYAMVSAGVLRPDLKTLVPRFLFFEGSALNRLISHFLTARSAWTSAPVAFQVYAVDESDAWRKAWRRTEDLVLETRRVASSLGARYALVSASTPNGVLGAEAGLERMRGSYPAMRGQAYDLDAPDRRMAAFCAAHDIPFLALESPFREETARGRELHWPNDGHWNVEGNDLAGRLVAAFVLGLE